MAAAAGASCCGRCGKTLPERPPMCARCMSEGYCDKTCQTAAWALHKVACAPSLANEAEEAKALALLFKMAPYYKFMPFISLKEKDLGKMARDIAAKYTGEFCLAISFDKNFIAELMYHGFLPMCGCEGRSERIYFLLPKLHVERCLVDFADVPAPHKSTIKRSNKYSLSVNQAFLQVCSGIVQQHSENWFYPRLVKAYLEMAKEGALYKGKVRIHSFELWDADGQLVAGECGYTVGAVYTSLSGFTLQRDGSGTVQMHAMSQLLTRCGFVTWDLGMGLPYKMEEYGGKNVSRAEFLERLYALRDVEPSQIPVQRAPAKLLKRGTDTTLSEDAPGANSGD